VPVELPHHRCYFLLVSVTGINCKVSGGGGPCDTDRDCGHFGPTEQGGKCLAGKCVCNKGYTCGKCQARGQCCRKKGLRAWCKLGVEPKVVTALACSRTKLLHRALLLASVTGEDCTQAAGGALCRQDADCSQPGLPSLSGKCVGILGDNPGICSCNATYGCPSCNTHVAWLASGTS
jgi:hypothetical protein